MSHNHFRQLVDRIFKDEAVLLGGIVATDAVPDRVVRRIIDGLTAVRERAHRHLELAHPTNHAPASPRGIRPHPAIAEFLAKLEAA